MEAEAALLEVSGLEVRKEYPIIRGIDFSIHRGERVGLIGRSGAGKSLTALSCLGILPQGLNFSNTRIAFDGVDLLQLPEAERARYRGKGMGLVFQEALSALNPVWSIGFQLRELVHLYFPDENAEDRAADLLSSLGLDKQRILRAFPHELSGGQRQRVLLAMALVGEPELLLADEMTASLDLLTQARVLQLVDQLCVERGLSLLMISHDLATVLPRVERVLLMEGGLLVEEAPATVFREVPLHPLSRRMLAAARGERLEIEMCKPELSGGCPYAARCPRARERCSEERPPMELLGPGHRCRCFFPGSIES